MDRTFGEAAELTGEDAPRARAAPAAAEESTSGRATALALRAAIEGGRWRSTPLGERPYSGIPQAIKTALGLGLRAVGLWRRGIGNALDLRVAALELSLPDLPASFDGYRILQISDPHFDGAPGLGEAIVGAVAGVETDLCVLTGDFRNGDRRTFTEFGILEPFARIPREVHARDGVFATLGNHDTADMVRHIEDLGIRVLLNETVEIRRGDDILALTGLDDVHVFYTPAAAAALAAGAGSEACRITLVHSPEMAGEAAAAGYALYLCGHCHGGQICLPGGRPVVTHLLRHRNLHTGLWRHGDMVGYTSRGAGVCGLPVRYNCRGEVTLFTLRRGPR